ncbi:unnamed protein product [Linum trigynum]|uniref:Integrase catalytic domain-containing protein n=1 Tax=Linum trigynum TaxID=586398 RepID=A0AAV2E2S1_9ROSI
MASDDETTKSTATTTKSVPSGSGDGFPPAFVLPHSDSPNQLFVGELLTDSNYGEWIGDITDSFIAKNKMGFVDGSLSKPTDGVLLEQWKRCDAMVKGWLKTAMSKEIRSSVRFARTSREIWLDLESRFGRGSAPRLYELRRSIALLQQEKSTVSSFYTKLRGFWDEIQSISPAPECSCGGCTCDVKRKYRETKTSEQLFDFLMGLDEAFSTVKTQILAMRPMPSLADAYHLVNNDEQQRKIATNRRPHVEAAAFHVQDGRTPPRNSSGRSDDSSRPRYLCDHCGKTGHTRDRCYELIGWPERRPNKGDKEKEQDHRRKPSERARAGPRAAQVEVSESPIPGLNASQFEQLKTLFGGELKAIPDKMTGTSLSFPDSNDVWLIDTGCNEHIVNDSKMITGSRGELDLQVRVPDGSIVGVHGIGSVHLSNGMILPRVLLVPEFKCNLLSVSQLTRDFSLALIFLRDFCVIQDLRSKTIIGTGMQSDGLYYLRLFSVVREEMACAVRSTISADLWHSRLGHPSPEKLDLLHLVPSTRKSDKQLCSSCLRAKQPRLVFPSSSIRSSRPFDIIHIDIWGGYKVPSLSGAQYFLTVVDDFTRGVWIYLLKFKSEKAKYLQLFVRLASRQFSAAVRVIQTDNGTEFQSHELLDFYAAEGIHLQTSCTDTPQQNGVVERKHRHILDTARALRFHANLPKRFWGECVLTAGYLINRLPHRALGNQTPYERLFNHRPSYDHLRAFGCLAYSKDTHSHLDKFGERGRACVFLGYPSSQKGYRLLELSSQKLIVSRDVIFDEAVFPFHTLTSDIQPAIVPMTRLDPSPPVPSDDEAVVLPVSNGDTSPTPIVEESTHEDTTGASPCTSTSPCMGSSLAPHDHANSPPPANSPPHANPPHAASPPNTSNSKSPSPSPAPPPRRSTRVTRPSVQLQGYDTYLPSSHTVTTAKYPLSAYVTFTRLSPKHRVFVAAVDTLVEPQFFHDAVRYACWREAMQREIDALEANGTWDLQELPPGKKAIASKWVYKIKFHPDGTVERYKARLVAKGFTQIEGVDYHDTFAPVAKLVTVRCVLAVAAHRGWHLHQMDVNNAFLHGDLHEEVYMKLPPGFSRPGDNRVCRLRKSLYGLKQASRNWYMKFATSLQEFGFQQSKADHSLFTYRQHGVFTFALIYVDDLILGGDDLPTIQRVKGFLHDQFSIKDLGVLKYFLGIEVARSRTGMVLSQRKYTLDILKDAGALAVKPCSFPIEQNHHLTRIEGPAAKDPSGFRRLVGRLQYLTVTRPDIVYAVNILSQAVHSPRQEHEDAAQRVLRYLKGAPGRGLLFPTGGTLSLTAYCDADWGGCQHTRRSTTGYFIRLGDSPISWRTKKQSVVARSSAEAEYRAMASTVSELVWLRWLLSELGISCSSSTPLYCDNQAALHIAANPVFHERTKHVEMDCHFVRERVTSGEIAPRKISSQNQVADMFTKGLGGEQFAFLTSKLGVHDIHASA